MDKNVHNRIWITSRNETAQLELTAKIKAVEAMIQIFSVT